MLPIRHFKSTFAIWPSNLPPTVIFDMNDMLMLKLTKEGVINRTHPALNLLFTTRLLNSDSQLKAFVFLHILLARSFQAMHASMPQTPLFDINRMSIMEFGGELINYYTTMSAIGGSIPIPTQSLFFLTQLQANGIQVDSYIDRVNSHPATLPFPSTLQLQELVVKISDVRPAKPAQQLHVHRVRTSNDRQPRSTPTRNNYSAPNTSPNSVQPFRTGSKVQCMACNSWGHKVDSCRQLAVFMSCSTYQLDNKPFCTALLSRWKQSQDRSAQLQTVRQLRLLHPDEYEHQTDEDILEVLTDSQDEFSDFI
jgi:hypothetical protein